MFPVLEDAAQDRVDESAGQSFQYPQKPALVDSHE